ncbi:protein IQ-DOMAIN 14-like [Olea europaea var. sylvestris]|uniref:protein IQ-DOMAIN 14-like n=1 Tax=Olea europaea var. sylvestris TaxID=158386 RepID=UPI000C1D3EDD|nr:protein IQ-DOMAIN 14-like [Olea europaea var. sylvestris]
MGKKGSWFSAIKKVFTLNSKEKLTNESNKKSVKEKKKARGILKHGETKSFIPLFREPSSIEQILGEADQLLNRHTTSSEQPITPTFVPGRLSSPGVASPRVASRKFHSPKVASPRFSSLRPVSPKVVSPRAASPKSASPKVTRVREEISYAYRPEPTPANQHLSAIKIQAAYRGYLARRSFRALRVLVRLQGVVRGQNVKRQTMNAMKQMQLLVRVQTQIQSRRIQMLENTALQRQAYKNDVESTLSQWSQNQLTKAGQNEDWDDSLLTKEEIETRIRKKVEAVIKKERSMAYAYSHQLWKANPKSAQTALDIRSSGSPWWWNWLERQLPITNTSESQIAAKTITLTPPRPISEHKPSPLLHAGNYKQNNFGFDGHESLTPKSSKSAIPVRTKQMHTPSRTTPPVANTPTRMKYTKQRASAANSPYDVPLKDDDSLTSCPPFSVPSYMAPTVSAKAKVRANSNPKERILGTPGNDSKRRFSFPLTPNIGPFKWNKGSNKDSTSQKGSEKHQPLYSIGDMSVDSTVSMPATVGRKPFNRFV